MADYTDPLEAAKQRMLPQRAGQSFFPAANLHRFSEQGDLLKDAEDSFYGGGQGGGIRPTPSPTPTPAPRSYFGGANPNPPTNFGMNTPQRSILSRPPQYDQLNGLYGWT